MSNREVSLVGEWGEGLGSLIDCWFLKLNSVQDPEHKPLCCLIDIFQEAQRQNSLGDFLGLVEGTSIDLGEDS